MSTFEVSNNHAPDGSRIELKNMNIATQSSTDVIVALLTALDPSVVKMIGAQLDATKGQQAAQAVALAEQHLRKANSDGVDQHEGFLEVDGKRITVDFFSPSYASPDAKDASFLRSLAERVNIGHTVTKTIAGL